MIYVTSDIHGDYIHFFKMMEKIRLSSEDRLYILGDAVDGIFTILKISAL